VCIVDVYIDRYACSEILSNVSESVLPHPFPRQNARRVRRQALEQFLSSNFSKKETVAAILIEVLQAGEGVGD
jgi:hypothetical protein